MGRELSDVFSAEAIHRLGYHQPTSDFQKKRYEINRHNFMTLFDYVESVGGPSREKSLALTALQESLMWLNAHVACHNVDGE